MKRLQNHLIGIDQDTLVLFTDFEDGGAMWTGVGPREHRSNISFSDQFRQAPSVHVSPSMWDIDNAGNQRVDLAAENVTPEGFELVFRTWGDTRVARFRASWLAIGELAHPDDWPVE